VSPAMGGTDAWLIVLTVFGGATMLIGAYLAIRQTYLKRILAYSTISALGVLTFLLGLGATPGQPAEPSQPELALYAAQGFAVFLLAHALYKAALFLVAGTVAHEAGTADVTKLGGLRSAMPITAAAAVLAALSMAGFPPFFGFISKELLFEATLAQPALGTGLTAAALLAGALFVVVSCLVAFQPFFGRAHGDTDSPSHRLTVSPVHEPPAPMWLGPALLAIAGLLFGLLPGAVGEPLVGPVVASVLGAPAEVKLVIWHGFNIALLLGAIAIAGGLLLYAFHTRISRALSPIDALNRVGPERWYFAGLDALMGLARAQTRLLQSGYLRSYLLIIVAAAIGLIGWAVLRAGTLPMAVEFATARAEGHTRADLGWWAYEHLYHLIAAGLILVGAAGAVHSKSRLTAIASLGVVGYSVALIYVFYGAPDLAITQFLVETLTVLLFVFVFYHLPGFPRISTMGQRVRDMVVCLAAGALMTVLVLVAVNVQLSPKISDYFAAQSVPQGHGRNIVNVILVDFRALDTLGEITVLAISGLGVLALLKLRPSRDRQSAAETQRAQSE
jgi:multicomponent Na+:H+ antiporter subunit A